MALHKKQHLWPCCFGCELKTRVNPQCAHTHTRKFFTWFAKYIYQVIIGQRNWNFFITKPDENTEIILNNVYTLHILKRTLDIQDCNIIDSRSQNNLEAELKLKSRLRPDLFLPHQLACVSKITLNLLSIIQSKTLLEFENMPNLYFLAQHARLRSDC